MIEKIKAALFGLAIGDALGVPVEFTSRGEVRTFPVVSMTGFGTWNQPPGTWSDDSSLAFCLAESLTNGYNPEEIGANFIKWYSEGYWGAHHKVFDVGAATRLAISRLMKGTPWNVSGGFMEDDNGNGSLMRILPLLFALEGLSIDERYDRIKEVSSITHAHFRSVLSCFTYLQVAFHLLSGATASDAYRATKAEINDFIQENDFAEQEVEKFDRLLKQDIRNLPEEAIFSGGYVIHTLEASLWCLLTTNNYPDAVLKAVNLGEDTDTTGCVTGGLAGLLYGYEQIPTEWINVLSRKDDIEKLCERLYQRPKK